MREEYPAWINAEERLPDDLKFVGIFGINRPVVATSVCKAQKDGKTYMYNVEGLKLFGAEYGLESILIPENALKWWFPYKEPEGGAKADA